MTRALSRHCNLQCMSTREYMYTRQVENSIKYLFISVIQTCQRNGSQVSPNPASTPSIIRKKGSSSHASFLKHGEYNSYDRPPNYRIGHPFRVVDITRPYWVSYSAMSCQMPTTAVTVLPLHHLHHLHHHHVYLLHHY